jgi:hypothetical protein
MHVRGLVHVFDIHYLQRKEHSFRTWVETSKTSLSHTLQPGLERPPNNTGFICVTSWYRGYNLSRPDNGAMSLSRHNNNRVDESQEIGESPTTGCGARAQLPYRITQGQVPTPRKNLRAFLVPAFQMSNSVCTQHLNFA